MARTKKTAQNEKDEMARTKKAAQMSESVASQSISKKRRCDLGPIEISIQSLGGHLCSLTIDTATLPTVQEIKQRICALTATPVRQQRLLLRCKSLLDDDQLDSLIYEHRVITLVRRSPLQMRWLELVTKHGVSLRHAPREIQDDREVALKAVLHCSYQLKYLSEELRNDLYVIQTALRRGTRCWPWIPLHLKKRREVVLTALQHSVTVLLDAPEDFFSDREIMIAAIRKDWRFLAVASKGLRADEELVSLAVADCGCALAFADPGLRSSVPIVMSAVATHGEALQFAAPALRFFNRDILRVAVRENPEALEFAEASDHCFADHETMSTAIRHNGFNLRKASAELRSNRELVGMAIAENGCALQYAAADLRADRLLALEAVKNDMCALAFVLLPFTDKRELAIQALRRSVVFTEELYHATVVSDESSDERLGSEADEPSTVDGPKARHASLNENQITYYVVGSWSEWTIFHALLPNNDGDAFSVGIQFGGEFHDSLFDFVEFQVVENESWDHRYYNSKGSVALGPSRRGHGMNWVAFIDGFGSLQLSWRPSRADALQYCFIPDVMPRAHRIRRCDIASSQEIFDAEEGYRQEIFDAEERYPPSEGADEKTPCALSSASIDSSSSSSVP